MDEHSEPDSRLAEGVSAENLIHVTRSGDIR
jgi:hypothetical protein